MPTHFRWLWYLVGLAGMSLAVVGLLAMIGSIVNDGLILPTLGVLGVGLGYLLVRRRRRRWVVGRCPRRGAPRGLKRPLASDQGLHSNDGSRGQRSGMAGDPDR